MEIKKQEQLHEPLDEAEVKIALFRKGWSQAALAVKIGCSVTAVNLAIKRGFFPGVTLKIRKALNL